MKTTVVQVLSIHDCTGRVLAFDLKDVLQALEPQSSKWTWGITSLDALGGAACESVCRTLEQREQTVIWLSGPELLQLAEQVQQTLECAVIAFPEGTDPAKVTTQDLDLAFFPSSAAEVAIVAVDSSYFEVYTKDAELSSVLRRRFEDVRFGDPAQYFQEI